MTRRALLTTYRQLFLLLMGLGLLARVLVPVGWMPHVGDGGIRLVLCTGYGPAATEAPVAAHHAQLVSDAHGATGQATPPSPDQPTTMGAPCPFTLAAAPALLATGVAAVMPLLPVAVGVPWAPAEITRATPLAAPPPPAIGPPTA